MKTLFEKILFGVLAFSVNVVYKPKVFYVNKSKQGNRFDKPTILVCNHINHQDGTIIGTIFRKEIIHHLAAKDRFENNKGMAWYLRHTGCIPIDRQNIDTQWVYQSIDFLTNKNENICIYPEGRHGKNKEILPFHSGVTTIAALSKAQIVMVYNDGPYSLFRRIKLIVSEPFHLDEPTNGMTADYIKEQTDKLRDKMVELQQELFNRINYKKQ
ncbi:MAG: 1-acyl-sn-glycerol-3-phosphate acyltransferase [Bacteroidales bacterium]|nr:1-acyl-sn-glycerol-3-phosphate acyltransferase [Bacteroidales bacterium]